MNKVAYPSYFLAEEDIEIFLEGCRLAKKGRKEKRFIDVFFYQLHQGSDMLTSVNNSLIALGLLEPIIGTKAKRK